MAYHKSAKRLGNAQVQLVGMNIGELGAVPDVFAPLRKYALEAGVVSSASAIISAYHGYKRNDDSLKWAFVWGLAGGVLPVIVPLVAVFQGYAEPAEI